MQSTTRLLTATAAALLLLSACGTTSENSGEPSEKQADACGGPDGEYVIGMSQANVGEPYRQRMNDDIKAAAKKVPQFTVEFADAAQDNAKQVSDVENFLTQQIDLLIISPNEAKPLTAVVQKAHSRGIPVIVLDRRVEGEAYTTWIGGDNEKIGSAAGTYVAEELLPDGGKVVELTGLPGSTPAQERRDGFHAAIAKNEKIKVIADASGDWLREKGQAQMDAILKAEPDIDVVYAHNDPMAEGAYLAAKTSGRQQDIAFLGIDALPIPSGGIKAVEAGRLSATFTYPTAGAEAVEAAKKLLITCADVPKEQTLETERITQENAAEVYREANPGS